MFWLRTYPLPGEVGGGWAPEFSSFLGPKWLVAISHSPKNTRIPGPNLIPLPLVMDIHASKTLCTWLYKSYVHK